MPFRIATVVSSNSINFVNAQCEDWVSGVKNAHTFDKVNWLTAHNYGKPK